MFVSENDTIDFLQGGSLPDFAPTQDPGVKDGFARLREAWASKRFEDLSVSRTNALREQYSGYIDQIETVTGERLANPEGLGRESPIPDPIELMADPISNALFGHDWVLSQHMQYDARVAEFEAKVKALKEKHPDLELRSRDDFMKAISEEGASKRAKLEEGVDVGWAGLGRFTGEVGALATDPVNIASMMFGGAGTVRTAGTTIAAHLGQVGRTMGTEALIGMASEAAIQPSVYGFKKDIGSPYGAGDVAENILMAGVGGAALSGTAEVAGFGFRALLGRWRRAKADGLVADTPETRAAEEVLQDAVDRAEQSPFPDGVEYDIAHARAMDEATAAAIYGVPNKGRTLDALREHERGEIKGLVERSLGATDTTGTSDTIRYAKIMPGQAEEIAPHVLKHLKRQDAKFEHAVRLIDGEGVRHASAHHEADLHPLTPEDFEHVPEVTQTGEFLRVEVNRGTVGVIHRKRYGDRWLNVVEEVRGKKNITLRMMTAYWSDAPKIRNDIGADARFPGSNPREGGRELHDSRKSAQRAEGTIPKAPTEDSIAPGKGPVKAAEEVAGTATEQALSPEDAVNVPGLGARRMDTDTLKRVAENGAEGRQTREAMAERDVLRLLDQEDILVPVPGLIDEDTGQGVVRSAKELLTQADDDIELAGLLRLCGTGRS